MQALDEGIAEMARLIEALRSGFAAYQEDDDRSRATFAQQQP
jgi:hypothetical protein